MIIELNYRPVSLSFLRFSFPNNVDIMKKMASMGTEKNKNRHDFQSDLITIICLRIDSPVEKNNDGWSPPS